MPSSKISCILGDLYIVNSIQVNGKRSRTLHVGCTDERSMVATSTRAKTLLHCILNANKDFSYSELAFAINTTVGNMHSIVSAINCECRNPHILHFSKKKLKIIRLVTVYVPN